MPFACFAFGDNSKPAHVHLRQCTEVQQAQNASLTAFHGQVVLDYLWLLKCGSYVAPRGLALVVIVKSQLEFVLETLCDVTLKMLVGVSGETSIPLTPWQGATHLLHGRWEAGGRHGAAGIQLEKVIYILVSACKGQRYAC